MLIFWIRFLSISTTELKYELKNVKSELNYKNQTFLILQL
jgi:hypothetical protein